MACLCWSLAYSLAHILSSLRRAVAGRMLWAFAGCRWTAPLEACPHLEQCRGAHRAREQLWSTLIALSICAASSSRGARSAPRNTRAKEAASARALVVGK